MDYQQPVTTWNAFEQRWSGLHNFLMSGELTAGFGYEVPSLEEIVDRVRRDEKTLFRSGVKQAEFDQTDIPDAKTMPLDKLLARPFILAHFSIIDRLGGKGQVFDGIDAGWVEPWRRRLREHEFTFDYVYAIVFVSGPNSATNYHMDYTHQLAWQRHGVKHFSAMKDPDRWTTVEQRAKCQLAGSVMPAAATEADCYTIVQPPGTVLWNAVTTPHWVETFDAPAATLTLVHSGLRHRGRLCPHAEESAAWKAANQPAPAPGAAAPKYGA